METAIYIVVVLLGMIWWRLGLISNKLNKDSFDVENRDLQRKEFLEESKYIQSQLDTIAEYLHKIDKNTDEDYQQRKAEFGD